MKPTRLSLDSQGDSAMTAGPCAHMLEGIFNRKIYLLAKDEQTSAALAQPLLEAGHEVFCWLLGDEALQAIPLTPADLIIIEISAPQSRGLELLKRVRERFAGLILLVYETDDELGRILGLELGADDCLTRLFSTRELLAKAQAMLRRLQRQATPAQPPPSTGLQYEGILLDLQSKTLRYDGRDMEMTASEVNILALMMAAPSRIFSRDELREPLSDSRRANSRSVDVHIGNLRKKIAELGVGFNPLCTVRGMGYRFQPTGRRLQRRRASPGDDASGSSS